MNAREVISHCFDRLIDLIDRDLIKPGSIEERDFLKIEMERTLYSFMRANNLLRPPEIKISWSRSIFSDPDEIKIEVDDMTVKSLKDRSLW